MRINREYIKLKLIILEFLLHNQTGTRSDIGDFIWNNYKSLWDYQKISLMLLQLTRSNAIKRIKFATYQISI